MLPTIVLAAGAAHGQAEVRAAASTPPPKSDVVATASTETSAYGDTDHVYVVTPTIAGSVSNPLAGWSLDGRYLVDVVTAASVDIVSTASGHWREVRHAGSLEGKYKPRDVGVGAAASVSSEPDYLSFAAGGTFEVDLDEKNFTPIVGYTYGRDTIGRSDTPFSVFHHTLDRHTITAGLTTVVDGATVASFVADVVVERGDQSKPYRYIPMFTPDVAGAVPAGASIAYVNATRDQVRPLEQLPTSRERYALTARLAHRFDGSTVRATERGYADGWGLVASTTDARWIVDLGRRFELGPHGRFHLQNAVSFWKRAYTVEYGADGIHLPALRTGDRELGPLRSLTFGGGVAWKLGPDDAPDTWVLGATTDVVFTHYFDDLYLLNRVAVFGALSLSASFE